MVSPSSFRPVSCGATLALIICLLGTGCDAEPSSSTEATAEEPTAVESTSETTTESGSLRPAPQVERPEGDGREYRPVDLEELRELIGDPETVTVHATDRAGEWKLPPLPDELPHPAFAGPIGPFDEAYFYQFDDADFGFGVGLLARRGGEWQVWRAEVNTNNLVSIDAVFFEDIGFDGTIEPIVLFTYMPGVGMEAAREFGDVMVLQFDRTEQRLESAPRLISPSHDRFETVAEVRRWLRDHALIASNELDGPVPAMNILPSNALYLDGEVHREPTIQQIADGLDDVEIRRVTRDRGTVIEDLFEVHRDDEILVVTEASEGADDPYSIYTPEVRAPHGIRPGSTHRELVESYDIEQCRRGVGVYQDRVTCRPNGYEELYFSIDITSLETPGCLQDCIVDPELLYDQEIEAIHWK